MRNLSRFIPIDGVNESLGENEVTTENGGTVVGYESDTTGSTQGSESVLSSIDKAIDNVETELEDILVGKGIKPEVIGESDTISGNTGNEIQSAVGVNEIGSVENGSKLSSGNSGIYEIISNNGSETGTTNGGSKFKVCGTNLPAKVSFWTKLKSFFKTEIAIEIPFSKGNSGTVSGNTSSGVGNVTGGNTSGGTGWSGLKNFFSFGKK